MSKEPKIKPIVIVGAGGMGRDTQWLIERINEEEPTYEILGYIDDGIQQGSIIDGYPILGGMKYLEEYDKQQKLAVAFAIGNAKVREKLVSLQQKIASENDVIMDGRDIGTVVLPNAEVKIYLTASSRVRAERRYKELQEKGETCDLDQIEKDIILRDEQDMNREISPLRQADDAVLVDSSDMSIEEVVNCLIDIVEKAK